MTKLHPRAAASALTLAIVLGCGGLFGDSQGNRPGVRPNPDARDMAERARLERDYQRAEAILKDRIRTDPTDHHAHRLLGDVNLTRAMDYHKKWKPNLARAYDSYAEAVRLQPQDCIYWARLAGAVTMAYLNDDTRIGPASLEALPLDAGWEHCTGPAITEIELRRDPTPEALEAAREADRKASEVDLWAAAAPWAVEAWRRTPLDQVQWVEGAGPPEPAPGLPFLVLEPPLQAMGVNHTYHRPIGEIERFMTSRVANGRAVFTDRRFPETIPQEAVVKADACRLSSYNSGDGVAVPRGTCSTREFLRSQSPLYDPAVLRVAGPGHYIIESAHRAVIAREDVLYESIRCLGGPVGRRIEYTPTCKVAYDKPNWLQRSVPLSAVTAARDDAHADRIEWAARMRPHWGDVLTERVIRGDVGVGMPYSLFRELFTDLQGCHGRGLLHRHVINGGSLEWSCAVDGIGYTFVDLQLVWFGPVDQLQGPAAVAVDADGD